jgi:predicted DNA-binding helix-hairpin-helix protein
MSERVLEKLSILADAAKYDVSCSSSGSNRKNSNKGLIKNFILQSGHSKYEANYSPQLKMF